MRMIIGQSIVFMSLPARGAWIEIGLSARPSGQPESLPARGAWIEIDLSWSEIAKI